LNSRTEQARFLANDCGCSERSPRPKASARCLAKWSVRRGRLRIGANGEFEQELTEVPISESGSRQGGMAAKRHKKAQKARRGVGVGFGLRIGNVRRMFLCAELSQKTRSVECGELTPMIMTGLRVTDLGEERPAGTAGPTNDGRWHERSMPFCETNPNCMICQTAFIVLRYKGL
jgi:hypothetical protein